MFRKFLFHILVFSTTFLRNTISWNTGILCTGFSSPKKSFRKLPLTGRMQQYGAAWNIFRNTLINKTCKAMGRVQLL